MDHELFDEKMLADATESIKKTRDGKLRAAVPHPIGTCAFLNDVSTDEMNAALRHHKQLMKEYPRNGEGLEAYVDASDTGYTEHNASEMEATAYAADTAGELNGKLNGNGHIHAGIVTNGHVNGVNGVKAKLANGSLKDNKPGINGVTNGVIAETEMDGVIDHGR